MTDFQSGKQLLDAWGLANREQRLDRAVKALMFELNKLHIEYEEQSLEENLNNEQVFCSCSDAYRMGYEALKQG